MSDIKVLIPTIWYPNPVQIAKCVFTEQIVEGTLIDSNNISINVISPIPSLYRVKEVYRQIKYKYHKSDNYNLFYPNFFKFPFNILKKQRDNNLYKVYIKTIERNNLEFNIIHVHGLIPDAFIAYKLSKYYNVKLVIHIHDTIIDFTEDLNKILLDTDRIIAVSNFQKNKLLKLFPSLKSDKIDVIYNGISSNFFDKTIESKTSDLIKFVHIGRLHPQKGVDWLVENINQIMKGINYNLDLYGNGPLENKIKKYIKENNLSDKVRVLDPINNSEVPELLSNYNFVISPTIYETFGIANLEALAVGIPIILSRLEILEEIFYDPTLVEFFNPKNISSLNNAILNAVNKEWDSDKLKAFAKNYSLEVTGKKIIELYQSL